jgi:hypothetical protein
VLPAGAQNPNGFFAAHQNSVGFSRVSLLFREKHVISASLGVARKSWLCQITLGSAFGTVAFPWIFDLRGAFVAQF